MLDFHLRIAKHRKDNHMPEAENASGESLDESSSADSEQSKSAAFTPSTEEQILAAHMGNPVPQYVPVILIDYDPQWPRLYEREEARVRSALGDRILLLEHVGSTSVPGLAAKPKIDMLLVVANTADEQSYVPALEAAGYIRSE